MLTARNATPTGVLRPMGAVVATLSAALVLAGLLAAAPASAASRGDARNVVPPSKVVSTLEKANMRHTPLAQIVREAKPLSPRVKVKAPQPSGLTQQGPNGPEERVPGVLPLGGSSAATAPTGVARADASSAAATSQNGAWPGAYNANPNRQIGKLYFDVRPGSGTDWRHCSGTAVNSENKSLVITAGHCVYSPDPDGNGVISGNGFWHEGFMFCPGYESGCRLGVWYYRNVSTTWSWFGGYGSARSYDFRDDVAVVLVSPRSGSYLVNAVGGQGITFNISTGRYRYAFGYPASDWRWPEYSYSGEDLIYCPGYDTYDSTFPGTMWMNCTMTGGSSGGPWLTNVGSSWSGYVNSVNSHKPYGGRWMNGPYFDSQESSLFNYWRNR